LNRNRFEGKEIDFDRFMNNKVIFIVRKATISPTKRKAGLQVSESRAILVECSKKLSKVFFLWA
jgi:hypothetical protein